MRVARILTRFNLGGPARQVLAADPLLFRRGVQVRLFVGSAGAGEGDLLLAARELGLDPVLVPGLARSLRPDQDLRAYRFLAGALRDFQPSIVHTHASKAGFLGRLAARAVPTARLVHSFHGHVLEGYFPGAFSRLLVRTERRLALSTDRLIAVSRATRTDLARLGVAPFERIECIPPGLVLEPFLALEPLPVAQLGPLREPLGIPLQAPLFLVVGRLAPVKRPLLALAAFAASERERSPSVPPAHLAFVGDGALRARLEQARRALGADLGGRVHLLGSRPDLAELLAESDGVLLASHSEGLPAALIEAGAAARPVVATQVGGVDELIEPGVNGLLASSSLEEAALRGLAAGLRWLCDRPEERRRMGLEARRRVLPDHTAQHLADGLHRVYREVLELEPAVEKALGVKPGGATQGPPDLLLPFATPAAREVRCP